MSVYFDFHSGSSSALQVLKYTPGPQVHSGSSSTLQVLKCTQGSPIEHWVLKCTPDLLVNTSSSNPLQVFQFTRGPSVYSWSSRSSNALWVLQHTPSRSFSTHWVVLLCWSSSKHQVKGSSGALCVLRCTLCPSVQLR